MMLLPCEASFHTTEIRRGPAIGLFRFIYREWFPDGNESLIKRTHKMVADSMTDFGFDVHSDSRSISIKGTCSREKVGDFIVGEFMGWSTFANMRIFDLLSMASLGAIHTYNAEKKDGIT